MCFFGFFFGQKIYLSCHSDITSVLFIIETKVQIILKGFIIMWHIIHIINNTRQLKPFPCKTPFSSKRSIVQSKYKYKPFYKYFKIF